MSPQTSRREMLTIVSSLGIGTATFQRALAQQAADNPQVSRQMVLQAEWVAGIELSEPQREMAADALTKAQQALTPLRSTPLDFALAPSLIFQPLETPSARVPPTTQVAFSESAVAAKPAAPEDLAFLPVQELAALLRRREITSMELTQLYLDRLERFDPLLKCVVNSTRQLALSQAERADQEIATGHYRGPLHGIPWGAKDLIAYPGYPTTWGAPQYQDQQLATTATVASRLEAAGAVLVAKLSSGHYALGDQWFGGRTRNPWNPAQGSSGSSAGSASATAAGLVGFTLGSETLGSITSPARRCGATGLRPTFGRVSRFGCMPLAWSLDKIGPICRTVEDCAVVLGAIHGADSRDPSSVDRSFVWPSPRPLDTIRVGFVESKSDELKQELETLSHLGVELVPVTIPTDPLYDSLRIILTAESSAIFDELTRKQEPKGVKHWPKTWVMGQFITAIDYLRAHRVRRQLMQQMRDLMREVDVLVGAQILLETNMTGHPQIVIPNGFREAGELQVPTSLTFTGRLYDESTMLAVAAAYQQTTGFHLARPPIETFLTRRDEFHREEDRLDEELLYE